ncbi:Uncharacterized protein APZ42_027838 [Daphnia magna]|uniref:Uncharacterized protein n=1 Tax=Daphnia magna TaxID=35525 RepID=A0A164R0S5_9CRUS|nr:Uncharacterized protein APZ42_027838 [Daphnia magna]
MSHGRGVIIDAGEVSLLREVPDPSQFQSDSQPQGEEFEDAQSYQISQNPEAGGAATEGAYESVAARKQYEGAREVGNGGGVNARTGAGNEKRQEVQVVDRDQGSRTRQAEFDDRESLSPQVSVSSVQERIDEQRRKSYDPNSLGKQKSVTGNRKVWQGSVRAEGAADSRRIASVEADTTGVINRSSGTDSGQPSEVRGDEERGVGLERRSLREGLRHRAFSTPQEAATESTNHTPFMMVYGREAVIPADLLAATGPSRTKLVGAEDLMKAMMELRKDVKDQLAMVQQRQKTQYDARVSAAPVQVTELNHELRKPSGKKTLVVHVPQMKKFVVESDKESDSDEEEKKQEHADTDLDVELVDTDSGVARADTGSEKARAETEEGMACAETVMGETPEVDTGVTPDASTAVTAVEPPARREKGRMRRRPLEPIAEMGEGLQDGKDSAVPAATESAAGRPTRKKRALGWMKNMLFFTLVCFVGQVVQADEMRGKYVTTEGAVFHPEGTLALGDSEWVVIYDVPTKRAEQVIKLVIAWVDDTARAFDKAITGNFPVEVTPFLEGDGTRRKRGLFDGGGQLLKWLFGTATTKDLESVHSRLKSFDKKGLEVVHLLQEQASLLNVTMGHQAEHESKISALMAAAGLAPRLGTDTSIARRKWLESVPANGNVRLFIHLPPPAKRSRYPTRTRDWLHTWGYRQLNVEFNGDEVWKCAPYMGSVCPFLKPVDRKGRMKSCAVAVFLQEQEGIQRNCHLDSKKWTGIDLFYIGGRKGGYTGKDNVTIVLQCPGKRIGGICLPQVLPAAGVIKIPRLCSASSDEWVLQASFRQMMPVNVTSVIDEEAARMLRCLLAPVVIMEEAPAALRTPTRIDLAGTSSHLKADERLQRQWEDEENAKRYPFEWSIGCLFPLQMVVYLWIEYRRLSSHVDTLLLARLVEFREPMSVGRRGDVAPMYFVA